MPQPTRSALLQQRLVDFGVAVSELTRRLPRDAAGINLSRQLARAAVAPAGLYAEARDAESTPDYLHKLKVCVKELREAAVWLEMIARLSTPDSRVEALRRECSELTAIAVTCVKKARESVRATSAKVEA